MGAAVCANFMLIRCFSYHLSSWQCQNVVGREPLASGQYVSRRLVVMARVRRWLLSGRRLICDAVSAGAIHTSTSSFGDISWHPFLAVIKTFGAYTHKPRPWLAVSRGVVLYKKWEVGRQDQSGLTKK